VTGSRVLALFGDAASMVGYTTLGGSTGSGVVARRPGASFGHGLLQRLWHRYNRPRSEYAGGSGFVDQEDFTFYKVSPVDRTFPSCTRTDL